LLTLIDHAPDALLVVRDDGTIGFANATAQAMFGYDLDALIGQRIEMLIPERLRTQHRWDRSEYLEDPAPRPMAAGLELHALCANGEETEVDVSLAPVETDDGVQVVAAIRDASGRHEAEEAHLELVTLLERQLERERVAADIHDDLIQSVYAIGLGLLERERDDAVSKEEALRDARAQVSEVIADLRSYVYWLRSPDAMSGERQIASRIESLLRGGSGDVHWVADLQFSESELTPEHGRHIYLIAKELISNVHRHAQAGEASFSIVADSEAIDVRVTDDGRGFRPGEVSDESFGLSGLRRRVESLDGTVAIESAPGAGTRVHVRTPRTSGDGEAPHRG
jgi:PAS domain S-box-containing protein